MRGWYSLSFVNGCCVVVLQSVVRRSLSAVCCGLLCVLLLCCVSFVGLVVAAWYCLFVLAD